MLRIVCTGTDRQQISMQTGERQWVWTKFSTTVAKNKNNNYNEIFTWPIMARPKKKLLFHAPHADKHKHISSHEKQPKCMFTPYIARIIFVCYHRSVSVELSISFRIASLAWKWSHENEVTVDILGKEVLLTNNMLQWNLSVTTTSIIKFITCDLFSNVF